MSSMRGMCMLFSLAFAAGFGFAVRLYQFHTHHAHHHPLRTAPEDKHTRPNDWHARHSHPHPRPGYERSLDKQTTPLSHHHRHETTLRGRSASPPLPVSVPPPSPPPSSSPPPRAPLLPSLPPLAPLEPGHTLATGDLTRQRLQQLARRASGKLRDTTIFLTFANSAFSELLNNWLVAAKQSGVSAIIVGAMDTELFKVCEARGIAVYSMDDEGLLDTLQRNETETPMQGLGTSNFRSDHKAFRNMGCKKGGFALALLQLGYSVLISDVDAVMLSDPMKFFDVDPIVKLADVWVSTDSLSPSNDRFRAKEPVNSMRKPQWWRYGPFITEQNGNMIDASFNTGILYFRATNASREFVRLWIDTIAAAGKNIHGMHAWDDQQSFQHLARYGPGEPSMHPNLIMVEKSQGRVFFAMNNRVKLGILPLDRFANGHTFFLQRAQEIVDAFTPHPTMPLMVHNTFQYHNTEGKKVRFRHQGMWHIDTDAYWTEGNFITYDPRLPSALIAELRQLHDPVLGPALTSHFRIVAHHLQALRNLFAVAHVLNRIPIVPPLECHCDRYWYPIVNECRSPGAELERPFQCTLDMLFNVEKWKAHQLQWREDYFLRSPRVPPELKLSGAVVAVVPAEGSAGAVAVAAAAAGAGVGQGALRLPKFSTQAQVKRALGDAPHRVLTLSSAVDVFCSFDDAATNQRFDHIMGDALNEIWCCWNNGSLAYDQPLPLGSAVVSNGLCTTPPTRREFPMVERAREIEAHCKTNEKCQGWNKIPLPPAASYRAWDAAAAQRRRIQPPEGVFEYSTTPVLHNLKASTMR